jgi:hypothetical protein
MVQARSRLNQTRERYNECKADESAECEQVRKETKTNARRMLVNSADRIIATLEKLRERIQLSERLTEEEAQERVAQIDAKIAEIGEAKSSIEELDENSDPEEIRSAAQQINNAWQNSKRVAKLNAARVVNAKVGGVIAKSDRLSERLALAVEKLEEQGTDTSGMEDLLEEFNSEIESAKAHYDLGIEKFNEARSTEGDVDEIMKEATSHMQEAHKDLREAHAVLVQLLRQIKAENRGDRALEEAGEELEEAENESEEGDE